MCRVHRYGGLEVIIESRVVPVSVASYCWKSREIIIPDQ